jgi:hypothetical protein
LKAVIELGIFILIAENRHIRHAKAVEFDTQFSFSFSLSFCEEIGGY